MSAQILLSLSFLFISISLVYNFGFFIDDLTPIVLILTAYICSLFAWFRPKPIIFVSIQRIVFPLLFITTFLIFIFTIQSSNWVTNHQIFFILKQFAIILLLPTISMVIARSKYHTIGLASFVALFIGAAILRFGILKATPAPPIDVFIILKEAPQKLLRFINPYDSLYSHVFPGITPDYYPYWPASFLLQLPFHLFFQDPRVLLILADLGASLLLYHLGENVYKSRLLAATYLFRPQSLFIIEGSWLTPLNFFLISLSVYLLFKKKKELFSSFILAAASTVQFFNAASFVYLIRYVMNKGLFLSIYIATTLFIILPFLFLNTEKFVRDTLLVYLRNPPHPSILIHNSLNLNTLYFTFFHKDLPILITIVAVSIILLSTIYRVYKNMDKINAVSGLTLLYFTIFVFGRQAFINYYYFIASCILLWMSLQSIDGESLKNK